MLTVLSAGTERDTPMEAAVLDYSGRGMRLGVNAQIPAGSAVRIEMDDQLILGEVCYCTPSRLGRYAVGLELEQALAHLDDLSSLTRALSAEMPTLAPARTAA
jgi:hypothetical protein